MNDEEKLREGSGRKHLVFHDDLRSCQVPLTIGTIEPRVQLTGAVRQSDEALRIGPAVDVDVAGLCVEGRVAHIQPAVGDRPTGGRVDHFAVVVNDRSVLVVIQDAAVCF